MADTKSEAGKPRTVRWQGITLTHMGATIGLLITLASATLGFAMHEVSNLPVVPQTDRLMYKGTIALELVSIAIAVVVMFVRLYDFRYTRKAAEAAESGNPVEHSKWHNRAKVLDSCVWILLWGQALTFILGVVPLVWVHLMRL